MGHGNDTDETLTEIDRKQGAATWPEYDLGPAQLSADASVNWRGIGFYLALCFGTTWSIEIAALARGVRFVLLSPATTALLALVMLIPAASAFTVRRWITGEGFANAGLRLGAWKPYLYIWIGVPCLFFVIYALTCAFGLGLFSTDSTSIYKALPPLPVGVHLPAARRLIALVWIA